MDVQAFIIHLVRATQRRENAEQTLRDCRESGGIEGEFWPAVDGSTLSADTTESFFRPGVFEPTYPFALKTGEIGCFLSHRQVWAEIIRRDLRAGLVLEDDLLIDRDKFGPALRLAMRHIDDLGIIKMRITPPKVKARLIDRQEGANLVLSPEPGVGAQANLISKDAARILLDRSKVFDRPVDTFIQSHWHTGIRPATCFPAGIAHHYKALEGSTIQAEKKSFKTKLWRELARFRYRQSVRSFSRSSAAPYPDQQT